jgi:hypothetical protein
LPLTSSQALAQVKRLYERLNGRRSEIDRLERYFRGEQPLAYATVEWAKLHQDRYKNFSDNWCSVVGTAPAERTEVVGFRLSAESASPLTDAERQLWRDWENNDLPAQSSQGFLTSSVAKRSAVLVWGDSDDEPVATWEHPSQVIVDYDPANPRKRRYALKSWLEDDTEYATLYEPGALWKFQRTRLPQVTDRRTAGGLIVPSATMYEQGGTWEPRQPSTDDTWPIDNPFGEVPVVEYLNRPMLGGEPLSDIAGTTAMQDAINLLWAYLFTSADFASMPARVVMGQEPPKIPVLDSNGQKIGEKPVDTEALTRGRMLWLTGEKTTIGQWDAAKLDVFTNVINVAVRHVSAQTKTPIYLIHGELGNVNGETLAGLDAPLVAKIRQGHTFYRAAVQETNRLMALVRGNKDVADQCRSGIVAWANPETRSDAQVSDAALKDRQVGWPLQAVLERRYGLGSEEIARILTMRDAELSDPLTEKLAAGLNSQTDAAASG